MSGLQAFLLERRRKWNEMKRDILFSQCYELKRICMDSKFSRNFFHIKELIKVLMSPWQLSRRLLFFFCEGPSDNKMFFTCVHFKHLPATNECGAVFMCKARKKVWSCTKRTHQSKVKNERKSTILEEQLRRRLDSAAPSCLYIFNIINVGGSIYSGLLKSTSLHSYTSLLAASLLA